MTPVFDEFLSTVFPDFESRKTVLSFIGGCCSNVPGYYFKKALYLYPAHSDDYSGIDTLKAVMEMLLGKSFVPVEKRQLKDVELLGKRLIFVSGIKSLNCFDIQRIRYLTTRTNFETGLYTGFLCLSGTSRKDLKFTESRKKVAMCGDLRELFYERVIPIAVTPLRKNSI